MQTGYTLWTLFATILFHCNPTSPGVLWDNFRHHICDDLLVKLTNIFSNRNISQDEVYDYGLHLINHILLTWGKSLNGFPEMPPIVGNWGAVDELEGNRLLREQLDYDRDVLAAIRKS